MSTRTMIVVLTALAALATPRLVHAAPGDVTMTFGPTVGSGSLTGTVTLAKLKLNPGNYMLTGRFNVLMGFGSMDVDCHLGYDTALFQASAGGATVGSAQTPIALSSPFVVSSVGQVVALTCTVSSSAGSSAQIDYITLSAQQVNNLSFQ